MSHSGSEPHRLNAFKPEISSWQTLLPELISQIITELLSGFPLPVCEPGAFPWRLGQICSAWRDTFVSSPKFWSSIVIDFDPNRHLPDHNFDRALDVVEMCLERSQKHSLTFRYWVQAPLHCDDLETWFSGCLRTFEALATHSERWENVYLYVPFTGLPILHAVRDRLPHLRSIWLQVHLSAQTKSLASFSHILEGAPQLQRVCIAQPLEWSLGLAKLTALHICSPLHLSESLQVKIFFSQFHQIEELYLSHLFYPDSIQIQLPLLKKLSLVNVEYLPIFDTPLLEELHTGIRDWIILAHSVSVREDAISSIKQYRLKKLSLSIESLDIAKDMLLNMPTTIQDLCLSVDLTALNIVGQYSIAKSVKTLTIELRKFEDLEQAAFLDLVKSWRIQSNSPSGFGPFETLQRFVLIVQTGKRTNLVGLKSLTKALREVFEEHDVQCDVQYVWSNVGAYLGVCPPQLETFTLDSIQVRLEDGNTHDHVIP